MGKDLDNLDTRKRRKVRIRLVKYSERMRAAQLQSVEVEASSEKKNRRGENNRGNSEHMRKIRAMRRFYNKQVPSLKCDGCSMSSVCPKYRAGYECAFMPFLKSHRIENEEDLMFYMKEMLTAAMQRTQQELIMERLVGGKPSLETTEAMSLTFAQMKQFADLLKERSASVLEVETEDESIIGRIFNGLGNLLTETREARKALPASTTGQIIDVDNGSIPVDSPLAQSELVADYTKYNEKTKE